MVIISCAICTKGGKILVSRQYTNVSKLTLEEYVRNFPKSISSTQQHTFVENESIRYIYLPLEAMYLVLITNKNSNIIEDLETIRLVHKVVVDICIHGLNESNVQKNAFDILLAFDDVISFGYRESVSVSQVQAALTMDSSDEKLHLMLLRARVNEAKEAAAKAEKERKANAKNPNYKPQNSYSSSDSSEYSKKVVDQEVVVNNEPKIIPVEEKKGPVNTAPKKGLQIVKKKDSKAPSQMVKKEEVKEMIREEEAPKKPEYNPLMAPVLVEFEEKFVCSVQRDGDLTGFEIKGDIFITVRDPTKGNCAIFLEPEKDKNMQLKPNPHLNRQFWNEKAAVAPKELKDSFSINTKINCLKYRYASQNVADMPFNFTYWFNEGSITCELEYNAAQARFPDLSNITVSFGYPTTESPDVKNIENGDYEVSGGIFSWKTPSLNKSNPTSNIEIAFSSKIAPDDIFPFAVDFRLPYNYLKVNLKGVSIISDNSPLNADFNQSFSVERFEIA